MKPVILIASLISATIAIPATADTTRKPIKGAEVIVFSAVCTPVSASEGFLQVELQGEKVSESFFTQGRFHSYSESSSEKDSGKWYLIPLKECRDLESELSNDIGRKLLMSGQVFERAFEVDQDIWGECRNHPREGGTRPCKKGTRKVTRYDREVVFELGDIYILNKNY